MIDVDVFPSDTSWLSEPTTGVHQFGGGSLPALKAKVASLEKGAKNLTADFVKSLLAAGATPTTPSYTSGPSKLKVPAELLKLSPDLAGEPRRCQLTFKGFQLVCDLISPG